MYPYDQNQDQNGSAGWDNDSGTYHYSYQQPTGPQQDPILHAKPPKKSGRGAGKVIALVLCCALVGGGAGVGGAAAYNALTGASGSSASDGGETVIYQNTTATNKVSVSTANGVKEMTLSEIYASYVDACVCINVTATVQNGWYQYESSGAGSGFIISEDGYIVTNYHVIDGASSIEVTLYNGESYDAKLVGGEELNDVAVLKIDGVSGLTPVVLGDSDQLVVGETVSTIGNALGSYSYSQTSGTVSATGRSVTMSDGTVMNMIQTDCTINSGNSGGPLFDQYGRVVGITSAKLSSSSSDTTTATIEGMGFAIPLNDVIDIITDYMQYGYITGRPYMGITVATVESQYQQVFGWPAGVYVNSVEDGSCAQAAGVKVGDIITKLGDTDVTSLSELSSAKNAYKAGETATLTVYRSGETITLTITFDEQVNNTQTTTDSSDSDSSATTGDSSVQDPSAQETGSAQDGYGYGNGSGGYGFGYGGGSGSSNPFGFGG